MSVSLASSFRGNHPPLAKTYLSEVAAAVLNLEGDESLAGNVNTLGKSLVLGSLGAAQDGGKLLLLLRLDLSHEYFCVSQI
jgi:hypothetical protein